MKKKTSKNKKEISIYDLGSKIDRVEKTVENLAVITKKGFDGVDKKFEEVDKRFDEVDERFESMDRRFDKVENILFAGHDREIENLRDRVLKIERKISKI